MNAFSATELARMQATQVSAMQDICKILTYSSTTDRYGNPAATYTAGSAMACGFDPTAADEVQGSGEVPTFEAAVRLPIGSTAAPTAIDPRDRLRITKRFGVSLTETDYEIVGNPQRGPSGLVVKVRKVTE